MKQFWFQIIGLLLLIFGALMFLTPNNFLGTGPWSGNRDAAQNNQPSQTNAPTAAMKEETLQIVSGADQSRIKSTLKVQIADTTEKRAAGLSGKTLAEDTGMLFIFPRPETPQFWMKGMIIPLDFIWINGDKVADITLNVQPPQQGETDDKLARISPGVPVDKVLEVPSGYIQKYGVERGDIFKSVVAF